MSSRETSDTDLAVVDEASERPSWLTRLRRVPPSLALSWLVILVVSRDIMIVGAVMLSWLVDKPVALKPLVISKLNTVAQIVLALVVLGGLGFKFDADVAIVMLTALVAALTLLSIAFYVAEWVRHMNAVDQQ